MSSGSKKQTVGYWYRMLFAFGWCKGPVDAFLEFRGGGRVAWKGLVTTSSRIYVNALNLWGGEKKEGGLQGYFDVQLGDADQEANDYLTSVLGADQPTYRGKAIGVWRGGRYGAMNPYPKRLEFKLRRIFKGWDNDTCWYPETAAVNLINEPLALYFSLDFSGSMAEITANGQSRFTNMKTAISAVLDTLSDIVEYSPLPLDIMLVGWGTQSSTRTSITRRNCTPSDITALKNWIPGSTPGYYTYFPAGLIDMDTFFAGAPAGSEHLVFFLTDGDPSTSNSSMTRTEIAEAAQALVMAQPGAKVYGINIDLADTTYTEYVDNTPDDAVPVVDGSDPSQIINTIMAAIGQLVGMNPAHILYDSLTASDMQREPIGMVNDASFRAAADTFYAENLGLCTIYDGDETVEDFQQRICNVAGCNLTQSRVDGQYYLDVVRAETDLESLTIIGADDILEFTQEPTELTELINQVSVEWFDPQRNESRATPPLQSLGAIQAAGGVNPEVLRYPEIPVENLALRVAARDLIARGTPLNRLSLTATRRSGIWKLRPGEKFRLQHPGEGIADMVCLLGDIDVGTLRDGRIRIKAVQDVFGMPATVYVAPEPSQEPEDNAPQPSAYQRLIEMPYVQLVSSLSHADLAALPEDAGAIMTMASAPSSGLNYAIYSGADGEDLADNGAGEWCPGAAVVKTADYVTEAFTLTGGSNLNEVELGTWALWDDEIVRVDSLDLVTGEIGLGRGCADTTPQQHAAGSRIFFCSDWAGTDDREYIDSDIVTAKLLTRTSSAELALPGAPALTVEMVQRQLRPYPPGRLRINGFSYPVITGSGTVDVDWAHRDKLLQDDQLIDATATDIGPEPGTSYTVRLYDFFNNLVSEETSVSGNSTTVDLSPLTTNAARIDVVAVRDGLESIMAASCKFIVSMDNSFAGGSAPSMMHTNLLLLG